MLKWQTLLDDRSNKVFDLLIENLGVDGVESQPQRMPAKTPSNFQRLLASAKVCL
jgi:hypothetical protein